MAPHNDWQLCARSGDRRATTQTSRLGPGAVCPVSGVEDRLAGTKRGPISNDDLRPHSSHLRFGLAMTVSGPLPTLRRSAFQQFSLEFAAEAEPSSNSHGTHNFSVHKRLHFQR